MTVDITQTGNTAHQAFGPDGSLLSSHARQDQAIRAVINAGGGQVVTGQTLRIVVRLPDPEPAPPPEPVPGPEPIPPPPPPSGEYLWLFGVKAEIVRARQRWTQGPYRVLGDAGHGGPYSPADVQTVTTESDTFFTNPDAHILRFNADPGTCWTNTTVKQFNGDDIRAWMRTSHAAIRTLLDPSSARISALKNVLLAQARDSRGDASKSSPYCLGGPVVSDMMHTTWEYLRSLLYAFDQLQALEKLDGITVFTAQERTDIHRFHYWFARWAASLLDREFERWWGEGRYNGVWDRNETISNDRSTWHYVSDGTPGPNHIARPAIWYVNRRSSCAAYVNAVGVMLERDGIQPFGDTSLARIKLSAELYFKESIMHSLDPTGDHGDSHRAGATGLRTETGLNYGCAISSHLAEIAESRARLGDPSLWDYETTLGYGDTWGGAPAGWAGKSLLWQQVGTMAQHLVGLVHWYPKQESVGDVANRIDGRYPRDGSTTHMVTYVHAMVLGGYRRSSLIRQTMLNIHPNSVPYPRSPQVAGPVAGWNGNGGVLPAPLLRWGQMDDIDPYPA